MEHLLGAFSHKKYFRYNSLMCTMTSEAFSHRYSIFFSIVKKCMVVMAKKLEAETYLGSCQGSMIHVEAYICGACIRSFTVFLRKSSMINFARTLNKTRRKSVFLGSGVTVNLGYLKLGLSHS